MDMEAHEELGRQVLLALGTNTTWPTSVVAAKEVFCGGDRPINDFHRGVGFATAIGWLQYARDYLSLEITPLGEAIVARWNCRNATRAGDPFFGIRD